MRISDGIVKRIFETSARKCGNGAIIYVPKENINDKFYIIIVENEQKGKRKRATERFI